MVGIELGILLESPHIGHTFPGQRAEIPRVYHNENNIGGGTVGRVDNQRIAGVVDGGTVLTNLDGGNVRFVNDTHAVERGVFVNDTHAVERGVHAEREIVRQKSVALEDGGMQRRRTIDMNALRQECRQEKGRKRTDIKPPHPDHSPRQPARQPNQTEHGQTYSHGHQRHLHIQPE